MNWLLVLLVWVSIGDQDIAKINSLKKEGEKAYLKGDFPLAAEKFSYLIDSMHIEDEKVVLNLGHSYLQMDDKENAQNQYLKLILSKDKHLKSVAYQQLGILSNDPKTLEKALNFFKSSLKADPTNDDSRYNYELLKKKLEEQKDQEQENPDNQNQDEQNQDQENQDQKEDEKKDGDQNESEQEDSEEKENEDGEKSESEKENSENQEQENQDSEQGEPNDEENPQDQQQEPQNEDGKEGDEEEQQTQPQEGEEGEDQEGQTPPKPSTADKLQEMNISEEKAKMILEALKNGEIQYIQQNQRRPTKQQDDGKPDW
ncbi:hypothetical protein BFP72_02635 [Reichenbachiella sp. 5M10]|nr:hypothetical protein BFP72_02635 [Reichenbachiella sp. 5M10]